MPLIAEEAERDSEIELGSAEEEATLLLMMDEALELDALAVADDEMIADELDVGGT